MSGIKILHTADLHLGGDRAALGSKYGSGRSEILNTFFRIIGLCKTEKVDFLLIAGDLFNTPFADSGIVSEVIRAISGIPETVVAIAAGNHDCACQGSVYRKHSFPSNTVVFTSEPEFADFPEKKVRLWGAGFDAPHCGKSLLSAECPCPDGYISLGVLHGELADKGGYNPITAADISGSRLDYLALGHIHKRSEISKSGETYFSYSGCPDGRGFDEDGSRGVYLGTVEHGHCALRYVETSSRLYIHETADVTGCTSSLDAAERIFGLVSQKYAPDSARNLYKISMTGTLPGGASLSANQIGAYLAERLTYCLVSDNTEPSPAELEMLAAEMSLRGIFAKKMLERINSANPDEEHILRRAANLGIRAFEREVGLNDN